MAGTLQLSTGTAPATPPSGSVYIYSKSDDKLYFKDSSGTEFQLALGTSITSTDDLPEGVVNLYFTSERAQDAVGSALTNTTTITLTYSDPAGTISAVVNDASITDAKISPTAAIQVSKLAALTASRAVVTNGSGVLTTSAATATEVGYLSGVTSGIQAQLDDLQDQHPTVNAWIFVSSISGSDVTGDGTMTKPLASIAAALALTSDASTTKRYGIHIKGTITEANIYMKPWVWYYGDSWGLSRINCTTGNVVLDPTAFTSGNSRCGMTNIYLTGSTGISLDFVSVAASGSHVVEIDNIGVNGSVTINPNNTNQYFQWRGQSIVFGSMTFNGALGFLFNTLIVGDLTVNQMATPQATGGLTIQNLAVSGSTTINSSGSFANPVDIIASALQGTLTISGTGANVTADAVSIPLASSVTVSGGGSLVRKSDATALAYVPTTSSNWNTVPSLTQAALDTLATSGVVKFQSQNLVLGSPNGSSGLPSFRALAPNDLPVLTGLTTSFGQIQATDTVLQAFSKLNGSQSLSPNEISSDFSIPTGYTLTRAETALTGSSTILIQGTATLKLI